MGRKKDHWLSQQLALGGFGYIMAWDEGTPRVLPRRKDSSPLLGHRGWLLYRNMDGEPLLHSLTQSVWWEGPVLRGAKPYCGVRKEFGNSTWGTGIYAFHELQQDDHIAYGKQTPAVLVRGQVEMFGTVVRHQEGLRGENAKIRTLRLPRGIFVPVDRVMAEGAGSNLRSWLPRHHMENGVTEVYVEPERFLHWPLRLMRSDQKETARLLERRYGVEVYMER